MGLRDDWENFDALVLGGGTAGKLAAWTIAKADAFWFSAVP